MIKIVNLKGPIELFDLADCHCHYDTTACDSCDMGCFRIFCDSGFTVNYEVANVVGNWDGGFCWTTYNTGYEQHGYPGSWIGGGEDYECPTLEGSSTSFSVTIIGAYYCKTNRFNYNSLACRNYSPGANFDGPIDCAACEEGGVSAWGTSSVD